MIEGLTWSKSHEGLLIYQKIKMIRNDYCFLTGHVDMPEVGLTLSRTILITPSPLLKKMWSGVLGKQLLASSQLQQQ